MASFSARYGYVPPREALQIEAMDSPLRATIWNALYLRYFSDFIHTAWRRLSDPGPALVQVVWLSFYKSPIDGAPYFADDIRERLQHTVLNTSWNLVFDLVEVLLSVDPRVHETTLLLNALLEREGAGYRIVDGEVAPLTSAAEVSEIEAALEGPFAGARHHLSRALSLFSDRDGPDDANSVKESISAVESAVREVLNDPNVTAGDGLKRLRAAMGLHPALATGFANLYGYTSDEGGIRHAAADLPTVSRAEARYFLITCSAFVNYLAAKAGTDGTL